MRCASTSRTGPWLEQHLLGNNRQCWVYCSLSVVCDWLLPADKRDRLVRVVCKRNFCLDYSSQSSIGEDFLHVSCFGPALTASLSSCAQKLPRWWLCNSITLGYTVLHSITLHYTVQRLLSPIQFLWKKEEYCTWNTCSLSLASCGEIPSTIGPDYETKHTTFTINWVALMHNIKNVFSVIEQHPGWGPRVSFNT